MPNADHQHEGASCRNAYEADQGVVRVPAQRAPHLSEASTMATGDRQHQGVMLPTDSPQGDALPKALRLLVPTAGASLGWWAGAPWPLVVLAGAVVAVRLVRLLVLELEQLGRDLERLPASWRWVHRAKRRAGLKPKRRRGLTAAEHPRSSADRADAT